MTPQTLILKYSEQQETNDEKKIPEMRGRKRKEESHESQRRKIQDNGSGQ